MALHYECTALHDVVSPDDHLPRCPAIPAGTSSRLVRGTPTTRLQGSGSLNGHPIEQCSAGFAIFRGTVTTPTDSPLAPGLSRE